MAADWQLNHEQVWARPRSPLVSVCFLYSSGSILGFEALHHERLRVSHSVAGGPQILLPSLCRKGCPARGLRGAGRGERRPALQGSGGQRCCSSSIALPGSQPAEPASSCTPGQMFPGLVGRQGLLLPPRQESDTTLANGLLLQPPGKSLPWGLCSVALKGDPAMVETRSFWPHLRPAESETLFLKISGGFSVSLPKMFLPQHPSHPSSPPSSLFSDLTFSTGLS